MSVRSSLKIVSTLILLVFVGALVFVATFDANNYKPQIIEQVENVTGRDFIIGGDINLSIFPWVGIQVEDVVLGNEKGFNAEQFAAIKQLDVKVNVIPLLKKQVEINTIRLHGLDVSMEVAEDKSNNWSGLSKPKDVPDADVPAVSGQAEADEVITGQTEKQVIAPVEKSEQQTESPLESLKIEGFEFVDAIIRYEDRSSGMMATVSELNLNTSAIEFDRPIDLQFGARIENNKPEIDTKLELTTELTINKQLSEFKLREFVFTILAEANEFIKQDEKIVISSDIDVLMDQQQVTLKSLKLSALQTETVADITVSQFMETPLIKGDIEVKSFDARKVAKRAGVELPAMAADDALGQVALTTSLKMQAEKLQADDFKLQLDDSTLTGWIHLVDISKQQLRYELAFDKLNINDYLPPEPAQAEQESAGATQEDADKAAAASEQKIELPVEMMRELDIKGDLRIATLTAKEYDIKQLLMSLQAQKGVIAIKPLSLQVLEGKVKANTTIDVQKAVPAYAINLDVDQVQAGPVVNPYLDGLMADKPLTMAGAVNLIADVKTSGETVTGLKKASKGKIILDMKQTSVDGFDPEYYARKSIADYVDAKGFGLSKSIMGDYEPREVTVFDKIHSTVNLADGKARTDDFLMDSRRVQIKAQGYADIVDENMDVTSSIRLPRGKTTVEKILDEPVYVRIHGPFTALQYDIDKERLKKSTTDVLENQAKEKAKQKIEEEKQRLKMKADEELKRQEEKAKQKLEDSLKDKFKGLF